MRATEDLTPRRPWWWSLSRTGCSGRPEHAEWLATARRREPVVLESEPDVTVELDDDVLTLTSIDTTRNAYRARTETSWSGLELALLDQASRRCTCVLKTVLSSGGDLNEFGTVLGVATGHIIRSTHNAGPTPRSSRRPHDRLRERTCYGAGRTVARVPTVVADLRHHTDAPRSRHGAHTGGRAPGVFLGGSATSRNLARVSGESIDVERALEWVSSTRSVATSPPHLIAPFVFACAVLWRRWGRGSRT